MEFTRDGVTASGSELFAQADKTSADRNRIDSTEILIVLGMYFSRKAVDILEFFQIITEYLLNVMLMQIKHVFVDRYQIDKRTIVL